ncbi:MAG: DUF1385 domain-containing protein [Clostridia bacterium]|nr:DUF1385 domain-containing protein [Clostridia bacterium]
MEGIMMRGPKKSAMAVRNPQGEIVLEEFETKGVERPAICRWPIIRGLFGYIDSMTVGYKCLMRSAEIAGLEDMVEEKPKKKKKGKAEEPVPETENTEAQNDTEEKAEEEKKLPAWVMTLTMVLSVVLGVGLAIGLFVMLPTLLFDLLAKGFPVLKNTGNPALDSLCKSAFEGVLKVILLVAYMAAISLMKDIRRTFMFHGAEHKTIFCYESGLELTVENIRLQRRFHPRCGTSFLILMVLVSIFISFLIDPISILISGHTLPTVLRFLVKILMLPLIVGIGYELIKFAGRHDNWLTRLISLPGVWLQHLTVLEPTDDMIECAIAAVKEVIPDDDSDRW